MRKIYVVIILSILLSNCNKSSNRPIPHVNCDNLITDTIGTGDTARIYMQNAFTPNGDGKNDISRAVVKDLNSILFTIYDRNNNVVYTTDQLTTPDAHGLAKSAGWQTNNTSTYDTYYYKIQATTNSGNHIGICGELYKLACFPTIISRTTVHFEDQLLINGTYSATTLENLPDCP